MLTGIIQKIRITDTMVRFLSSDYLDESGADEVLQCSAQLLDG